MHAGTFIYDEARGLSVHAGTIMMRLAGTPCTAMMRLVGSQCTSASTIKMRLKKKKKALSVANGSQGNAISVHVGAIQAWTQYMQHYYGESHKI